MTKLIIAFALFSFVGCAALSSAADAAGSAALRRKCAHMLKVKLGIKETGSSNDLRGVRGAVARIDRCVANGGKLD
jgi:hypothetical protein